MKRIKVTVVTMLCGMAPIAAAGGTVGPGTPAPEPETLALIALGVVALIVARTRKRK